jgi:hypothetical protein
MQNHAFTRNSLDFLPSLRQNCDRHHKGLYMFHKNLSTSLRSVSPRQLPNSPSSHPRITPPKLVLLPPVGVIPHPDPSPLIELIAVAAPRCSSFLAEAAVLVFVLALLDRFMIKGRMELNWTISAIAISLGLLAASIVTDFSSRRWLRRH